jgi:hypothetical protein
MIGAGLQRLLGGLYMDLGRDHRASVFLAGSGRAGTTWVSEIINYRGEYRYVFEPFHPGRVDAFKNFKSKQYLRPDDRREEYLGPARKVLTGGLRSRWTDRFHRKFVARQRLIKDIRANLILGWMRANFPGMPIILLLRHPCAVVASRLALGWKDNLYETMEQGELVEDFLRPMEPEIRGARDAFERHLFLWCIENYLPLRQFAPGEIHLAFYENFLVHPDEEIDSLFSFLGKDFDERVYRTLKRASPLSRKDTGSETTSVDAWRRRISDAQLQKATEIQGLFGLQRLYGGRTMPDPSAAYALMDGVRARK